jgi:hypothetical protein
MANEPSESTTKAILEFIKDLINTIWPALGVMLWNYEETKVDAAKAEAQDTRVQLQVEKNHETIDEKYVDKSDLDVINDVIGNVDGSGGQSGQGDSANTGASTTGNNAGPKKS